MASFFDSLKPFDPAKTKAFLKMGVQRIQIATNKKTAAVKATQREVASLLAQGKDEKAAIKVESVIREDATIEAYGILELICDLLHERARLIAAEKECPEDIKSAVHTLIWATNRADITELHEVKKQFQKKWGKEFVERAEKDEDRLVNERVAHKLSVRPPSAAIVEKYMREIAAKNNVDWTPQERPDLTDEQKAFSSMPAPTGTSVGMGPASGFGHLYNNTGGGGGGGGGGSMPIARPVSPPPPPLPATADLPKDNAFQPPSRPPPPVPTEEVFPPSALSAAVEALPPIAPSAPVASPDGGEGGGDSGAAQEDDGVTYDIPLPPTELPAAPAPELPPAPPTSGSGGPGGDVDDLLSRFNRLQGRH